MGLRGLGSGERAALVIHECQNGMVNPAMAANGPLAANAESRGVVPRINGLATLFRERGLPVVLSTIEPRLDLVGTDLSCLLLGLLAKRGVVAGKPQAELHPGLSTAESDVRIRRVHGLTPFHGTELESYLRSEKVDTVVLTGVSSDIGIPGAALEAINRGFRVVVPEDCIAGSSVEAHEWQVTHTLPLLASVTTAAGVVGALGGVMP